MILSKTSNNNWTPTAGGTGTFIGTLVAFNAIKDTLPVNTVAYITDDGNGDLQPVDAVTNGDMHPVTSNAVYDRFIQESSDRNTAISNDRTSHFGCNPSGAITVIEEQIVTSSVSWTATSNGYVYFDVRLTEATGASAFINGVKVWMHFSGTNGSGTGIESGIIVSGFVPIKSGQVFSIAKGYGPTSANICRLNGVNFIPAN